MRSRGPLKDLKGSKLILNVSKLFPWSSRISLVPFRTFRGPLFPKPVPCQELFFAVSYSKLALEWHAYKKSANISVSVSCLLNESFWRLILNKSKNNLLDNLELILYHQNQTFRGSGSKKVCFCPRLGYKNCRRKRGGGQKMAKLYVSM